MKTSNFNVKKDEESPSTTLNYQEAESLDELVEQFTEEVVFSHAMSSLMVWRQGFARGQMKAKDPKTGKALQEALDEAKPGVRAPAADRVEKLRDRLDKLSPEEKAELLAQLTGKAPPKPAPQAAAKPAAKPAPAVRKTGKK